MAQARIDPRAHVNVPIQVLGTDGRSPQVTMETIDLSAGGAFCRAPGDVSLKSQIRIRIDLPSEGGKALILVDALVLRVDRDVQSENHLVQFLVALYFLNLRFDDRRRLQQFIFGCLEEQSTAS